MKDGLEFSPEKLNKLHDTKFSFMVITMKLKKLNLKSIKFGIPNYISQLFNYKFSIFCKLPVDIVILSRLIHERYNHVKYLIYPEIDNRQIDVPKICSIKIHMKWQKGHHQT